VITYWVRISSNAYNQVAVVSDWYASNADLDVAVAFEEEFERAALSLATMPLRYCFDEELNARRVYVAGFPYAAWYDVDEANRQVVILGISHSRMATATVARRIGDTDHQRRIPRS
jgi:plasmid stabilization system protein ParE